MTIQDQGLSNPEKPQPSRAPIEGRDELNLVELPFSLISYENKRKLTSIERRWTEQGREFYLTVTPNPKFGLPTFRTEEVCIAALELTHRKGFKNREIHTTKREMLQLMRWPDNGHYRQALVTAFGQLTHAAIETNRFWDHSKREYAALGSGGFGIIDDYFFFDTESRSRGQLTLPLSYFRWNQVLWDSFQAGYIKRLDTALYFSLESNLARRLYRYVDKWLYRGGQQIDLYKLAHIKLGMSDAYRYPSEVATKLKPAVAELNERGVAKIRIEKSKGTESGYKVVIQPPESRQSAPKALKGGREQGTGGNPAETQILASGGHSTPDLPVPQAGLPSDLSAVALAKVEASAKEGQDLTTELTQRGISPATAQRLVQKHDPSRVVRHIEIFDFLVQKPDHDIKNPPAYLRKMIEEGWFVDRFPEGFTSREEQEAEQARKEQAKAGLLAEWNQAVAKVRAEVGDWAQLPPDKRIDFGRLDAWIVAQRLRLKRTPTDAEQAERLRRMVAELRTPEQELACRLSTLRFEFTQKAVQQGIGDISFPQ